MKVSEEFSFYATGASDHDRWGIQQVDGFECRLGIADMIGKEKVSVSQPAKMVDFDESRLRESAMPGPVSLGGLDLHRCCFRDIACGSCELTGLPRDGVRVGCVRE